MYLRCNEQQIYLVWQALFDKWQAPILDNNKSPVKPTDCDELDFFL